MRKSIGILFLAGMLAVGTTGCGRSTIPELSEEQTELISEYAAGLILKYDKGYQGRLVEIEEETEPSKEGADGTPNQLEEPTEKTAEASVEDVAPQVETQEEVPAPVDIASFLGLNEVGISYSGMELCDSYPNQEGDDSLFFTMEATEGYQLLVTKFMITNNSGSDMPVDILNQNIRFRLLINDSIQKNALTTLLLEDLATFNDTVPAGAGTEAVLVFEVTPEEATQINTISLIMKKSDENATAFLQ